MSEQGPSVAAAPSASTSTHPTSPPPQQKRRAKNILRDYYGLGDNANPGVKLDPLDPDSPAFDAKASYDRLVETKSLAELLRRESELITEIRELDGERQSLVYNHHHELVAASETIRKMKTRAESLDPSLDQLRDSFSAMSQLSSSLALNSPPPGTSIASSSLGKDQNDTLERSGTDANDEPRPLDPLTDLAPIVYLPQRLRDLIAEGRIALLQQDGAALGVVNGTAANTEQGADTPETGLAAAERLWGRMEGVLSAWAEAGVPGVREIVSECRAVLRAAPSPNARIRAGSVRKGSVHAVAGSEVDALA